MLAWPQFASSDVVLVLWLCTGSERNVSKLTLDGVDVMGERLAQEVGLVSYFFWRKAENYIEFIPSICGPVLYLYFSFHPHWGYVFVIWKSHISFDTHPCLLCFWKLNFYVLVSWAYFWFSTYMTIPSRVTLY